jgi:hypothetical protein
MTSKREHVLAAVFGKLRAIPLAIVKRNEALPSSVPANGLVILRDGDPGEPDVTLNPRTEFFNHRAEIEVFVTRTAEGGGEAVLDELLSQIGAALAADRSLGGLAENLYCSHRRPRRWRSRGRPHPRRTHHRHHRVPGQRSAYRLIFRPYGDPNMPKVRAYGADATLLACRETSYGVAPLTSYRSLDFKSCDLSSEQPLGDDPLLGRGRNAQDPYRGLITDEGRIEIPLDLRGSGFWLTGLFGNPATTQTKASGHITFSGQPNANSTIALNGVAWTFVSGTPSGNQTQIGATIDATLTALASDLNASADAQVSKCTYAANTADDRLEIQFDVAGTIGNSFTLAASASSTATVSAATLTGGGYRHEWLSGGNAIPSFTFEIGRPQLITPAFFRHLGTVTESLAFEMGHEGPANGTVQLVAQGEEKAAATIDATPDAFALKRFSQGRGFIERGGVSLAGVTGGSLTFSNNLERVRVIRDDGKIEAAEPTIATCTGAMTVRFDGATLVAEAANAEPVSLTYGFTMAEGWSLDVRTVPGVPAEAEVRRLRSWRRRGQLRLARRLR